MTEEHEEIPWSMLVEHGQRVRSRTWYVLAAIIMAVAVAVAGFRWIDGRRHGGPVPALLPTTTLPTTTTTTLLSEADLMAVEPGPSELAAVARAEWFVADYFTIDGTPAPDLLAAFPDDAVLPDLPHFADGPAVSFVEWARAYAVRPAPDGYVVTVLFRTLFENAEGRYERSPVRAVDVIVILGDGQTAVGDLPTPVEPPIARGLTGWLPRGAEASPETIAAALAHAGRFTPDPTLIESGSSGEQWRVVFTLDDPSGARFPMVVRSSDLR